MSKATVAEQMAQIENWDEDELVRHLYRFDISDYVWYEIQVLKIYYVDGAKLTDAHAKLYRVGEWEGIATYFEREELYDGKLSECIDTAVSYYEQYTLE